MSIYYSFNRRFKSSLKILVLPEMSSQTVTYDQVASPYLTPVVDFTAFSLDTSRQTAAQESSTGALWKAF
jgi:hypothetical protein